MNAFATWWPKPRVYGTHIHDEVTWLELVPGHPTPCEHGPLPKRWRVSQCREYITKNFHQKYRYRVSGRDMLAYGYKYGAEDRRALERAFDDIDRRDRGMESGWPSYSSAREEWRVPLLGSRGSAASATGQYGKESREYDTQSLVDGMGMVRIGAGRGHDNHWRDGHGSYHGESRSRSTTSARPRAAGNRDRVGSDSYVGERSVYEGVPERDVQWGDERDTLDGSSAYRGYDYGDEDGSDDDDDSELCYGCRDYSDSDYSESDYSDSNYSESDYSDSDYYDSDDDCDD